MCSICKNKRSDLELMGRHVLVCSKCIKQGKHNISTLTAKAIAKRQLM